MNFNLICLQTVRCLTVKNIRCFPLCLGFPKHCVYCIRVYFITQALDHDFGNKILCIACLIPKAIYKPMQVLTDRMREVYDYWLMTAKAFLRDFDCRSPVRLSNYKLSYGYQKLIIPTYSEFPKKQ